jgi:mono/diheme cytochrome c family protein
VTPRLRILLLQAAAGGAFVLVALLVWESGLLTPAPRLARTPEAIARGRTVLETRCLHCHATIPLAPRVSGWTPRQAYDAIGRLPALRPAMPPFGGTEQDRRNLAVYLSEIGGGVAPPP